GSGARGYPAAKTPTPPAAAAAVINPVVLAPPAIGARTTGRLTRSLNVLGISAAFWHGDRSQARLGRHARVGLRRSPHGISGQTTGPLGACGWSMRILS